MTDLPYVPMSWGELIDKITILEIKITRLPTQAGRDNAAKELELLCAVAGPVLGKAEILAMAAQLKELNQRLWEIEDQIREHERSGEFDAAFVELARCVYKRNDERGALKRKINLAIGSTLIEEKSYRPY
jgi:Family of unknown function (DUF6165)